MKYPDNRDIPWKKWFAWHPIIIYTFNGPETVWLEIIKRRKQYYSYSYRNISFADNYKWEHKYVF